MKKFIFLILVFASFFSCLSEEVETDDEVGDSNLEEKVVTNVSYGEHERQVYDIYLPSGRDENTPIILMVHGGAWKEGRKEDFNSYVNQIKKTWANVAIVNMNYRLASNENNIHHDEIMADIKSTIGHVIENKSSYDTSTKMGIMGASAGAQLAMIYAYKYNDYNNISCVGDIFGPSRIRDWDWYSTYNIWLGEEIGSILTRYVGQPWNETAYEAVSPYHNITASSQPTIIFHGTADPIVPIYQSQWFNGKLKEFNVESEYHEYLAFHSFDGTQRVDVINKLVNFFKPHLE